MSNVSELKRCPKCGEPIPAEAPQGLCPKCLLQQACVPTEAGKGETAPPAPPTLEELAAAFPQLEILQLIGRGGMGFVFKARQPKLDRFVALKILPQSLAADPAFAERFTREGRILARLNHPNIVTLYEFGIAELPLGPNIGAAQQRSPTVQTYFFLMEFVDGVNLRQAMKVGRFTPAQALLVVPKICEALQFAHNEGILHRDIKPENILLDTKGRVKIADFGIAKLVGTEAAVGQTILSAGSGDFPAASGESGNTGPESPVNRQAGKPALPPASLTDAGKILGTPAYMAPEQLEHPQDVDQRADIYSLGVVFYEMLTGELPLGRFAPPSEKSTVDPRMDEVVLHTLEKERERRTQTAGEVKTQVEAISGIASASPVGNKPVAVVAAPIPPKPDRFWRWFAVGALALIAIPMGISILGILAAIAIPNIAKARQRALASHQAQLALPSAINPVSAAAETWSPTVAPGSTLDVQKVLDEAKEFRSKGAYEEALQRHIWYHNHALEFNQGHTGVRLSFALSEWMELGRRYPKAKQALVDIRDNKTREILEGPGYHEVFQDVASINRELQNDEATYALFKTIHAKDRNLAQQCYFSVEGLLVEKGEYQLCLSYMRDPQWRFSLIRQGFEMEQDSQRRMAELRQKTAQLRAESDQRRGRTNTWSPPDTTEMMKASAQDRFTGSVCWLVEILVGTGNRTEAENIRDQAIAILDDPRLKSAVDEAEKKVHK